MLFEKKEATCDKNFLEFSSINFDLKENTSYKNIIFFNNHTWNSYLKRVNVIKNSFSFIFIHGLRI